MVQFIRNLTVRSKLSALAAIFCIGFVAFAYLSWQTLEVLKIRGPYYRSIVQGKDIIADVLPPPKYIIESYLLVQLLADETDRARIDQLIEKGKALEAEFRTRQDYWEKDLEGGELKSFLNDRSTGPALEFFRIRNDQFLPAVLAGNRELATQLARGVLRERYEEHRTAVDRVVELAIARNAADEAAADAILHERTRMMFAVAAGILLVSIALAAWFIVLITRPLEVVMSAARGVAGGNLRQDRIPVAGRDEIGQLAEVFNEMLESLGALAAKADAIARDDLHNPVLDRAGQGDLESAFATMVGNLRALSTQADAIARGDLKNSALSTNGSGVLSGAFARMVTSLRHLLGQADAVSRGELSGEPFRESVEGDLGHSFGAMIETIRLLIRKSKEIGTSTSASATELLAASQQMSRGANDQASKLSEVTAAMTEMSASIQEVSESSASAARLASETTDVARGGSEVVHETSHGLEEIRHTAEEALSRVHALAEASTAIGNIVGAIQEIAGQTNLLALNAAIEAARAGEQGRSFAVVADEVRRLAERSSKSAGEISEIIERIQSEMASTRDAMTRGARAAESSAGMAGRLSETFSNIQSSVAQTHKAISEITAAINEQARVTDSVASSVDLVNKVARQTEASADQIVGQANQLQTLVTDLEGSFGRFRL